MSRGITRGFQRTRHNTNLDITRCHSAGALQLGHPRYWAILSGERRNRKCANVETLVAIVAVNGDDHGTVVVVSRGSGKCFAARQGSRARSWLLKLDSDDLAGAWVESIVDMLVGDRFAGGSAMLLPAVLNLYVVRIGPKITTGNNEALPPK